MFYNVCQLPWLVGGDFNAISNSSERSGGASPSSHSMNDFNHMIMSCNLIDIGFVGNQFTWNRGHLWQRLDRVLFNDAWINDINVTNVHHLSRTLSDHSPLLITIKNSPTNANSTFRFQNMWLLNSSFFEIVDHNWNAHLHPDNSIVGMNRLWFKLKRLKQVLNWWNHNIFKNLFTNIHIAENCVQLNEISWQNDPSDANLSKLQQSKIDLVSLQVHEETYWKQKAAARHLVEGDSNTKYFHALTKRNRIKNSIKNIQRGDGSYAILIRVRFLL
ncbi:hypothetical protein KFK09_010797 [Dendrobium nobile]|uniref:Endonuclease/exonuclease/phosphatase domain-containing protein n=1 Tax=Dendrobium nobile TaxID=94219 RepID=A0A8T3BD32_DENNO|nr:hypothetical protein KFK09_010797 [Dendrobium nobile]